MATKRRRWRRNSPTTCAAALRRRPVIGSPTRIRIISRNNFSLFLETVMLRHIDTAHLDIAYEEAGPAAGRPFVLVHGWPDDVRCWDQVTPELVKAGYRVLAPYLRGCGPTRFLSSMTSRSGAIAALGQDLADFIDRLDLRDAVV